jgi:hypothetical protein
LPEAITQYAPLDGKMENTADILLLVRPDYTIYDELRKTPDFMVFSDMRLAGVGMIGVVHATRAIDAVQRFIGRIEKRKGPDLAVNLAWWLPSSSFERLELVGPDSQNHKGESAAAILEQMIRVRGLPADFFHRSHRRNWLEDTPAVP